MSGPERPGTETDADVHADAGAGTGAAAGRLLVRDVTSAGRELGRATLEGLPPTLSLGELLTTRVRADVERYNADPGTVYVGLVQPADAIRYSDGHHLRAPRRLDADRYVEAARAAVGAGLLAFVLDGEATDDLTRDVEVARLDEVVMLLRRPVVARDV